MIGARPRIRRHQKAVRRKRRRLRWIVTVVGRDNARAPHGLIRDTLCDRVVDRQSEDQIVDCRHIVLMRHATLSDMATHSSTMPDAPD